MTLLNPVPPEVVADSIRGAFVIESDGMLTFRRLPPWTQSQFPDDPWLNIVSSMGAGVRLELISDATQVEIRGRFRRYLFGADRTDGLRPTPEQLAGKNVPAPVIAVQAAGHTQLVEVHPSVIIAAPSRGAIETSRTDCGVATIRIDVSPAPHPQPITIWLSQTASVESLTVASNGTVQAAARTHPRWTHYGSSISQCGEASNPLLAWPVAAAGELDLDLTNLGLGGNAQLDPFAARTIRDLPAQLITLELGINIVNAASMRERTFVPAVHGFLDTLREGHPHAPIIVLSPIYCSGHEHQPGPTVALNGKAQSAGVPADLHDGQLTLVRIRQLLRDIVAIRSDPSLHYLDGLSLLSEADSQLLPDGLHPNDEGYARIAERFVATIKLTFPRGL